MSFNLKFFKEIVEETINVVKETSEDAVVVTPTDDAMVITRTFS